ncbi:hypothetical protein AMTR_s00138p00063890, partial [Amborella trichopoda]
MTFIILCTALNFVFRISDKPRRSGGTSSSLITGSSSEPYKARTLVLAKAWHKEGELSFSLYKKKKAKEIGLSKVNLLSFHILGNHSPTRGPMTETFRLLGAVSITSGPDLPRALHSYAHNAASVSLPVQTRGSFTPPS